LIRRLHCSTVRLPLTTYRLPFILVTTSEAGSRYPCSHSAMQPSIHPSITHCPLSSSIVLDHRSPSITHHTHTLTHTPLHPRSPSHRRPRYPTLRCPALPPAARPLLPCRAAIQHLDSASCPCALHCAELTLVHARLVPLETTHSLVCILLNISPPPPPPLAS
jgi:hypothetical protein